MGKKYIIPFNMDEGEIRKNFLDWVIIGEHTPIDIAYRAEIKSVNKLLYPVEKVFSKYTAKWSAMSFWEHTEEYEVVVPMVRYMHGNIGPVEGTLEKYRSIGASNKRIIEQYDKIEKKEKTVLDKKEKTRGTVTGKYSEKVILTEENDSQFESWLDSIPLENKIDYSESAYGDAEMKKVLESDENIHERTIPNIKAKAKVECKEEVPGTRYEDFSLDDLTDNYEVDVYYLPVYEITYEYNGQQFKVLLSGCVKDSAFSTEKPVDTDLEAKSKAMNDELSALKSARLKTGLMSIGIPTAVFIITLFFDLGAVFYFLAFLVLGGVGFFLTKSKFLPANNEVKSKENQINVYKGNLDEKKKAVLAIVSNDSLSADEQKEQIKKLIEG